MPREPLLELRRLQVAYGGIQAVKGIDLEVGEGELVCLIGANGAGKTTTLKAHLRPAAASSRTAIRYDGEDITGTPAFELRAPRPRDGARRPRRVRRAHHRGKPRDGRVRRAATATASRPTSSACSTLFPRLKERRRQTAGTLSGGEQQMLAMGRALMTRPKLLLLDEPSMGLAPLMVQKIFETIVDDRGEGVTILLVEQNAKLALEVSHRGYVMESGEITLEGDAKSLLHDPAGARGVSRRSADHARGRRRRDAVTPSRPAERARARAPSRRHALAWFGEAMRLWKRGPLPFALIALVVIVVARGDRPVARRRAHRSRTSSCRCLLCGLLFASLAADRGERPRLDASRWRLRRAGGARSRRRRGGA